MTWNGEKYRHSASSRGIPTGLIAKHLIKTPYSFNTIILDIGDLIAKGKKKKYKGICLKQPIQTKTNNFIVVIVPKELMGDYIALHGLLGNNELPIHLRNRIPTNQVWIRQDILQDKDRFQQILWHETEELKLMTENNLSYKDAHNLTTSKEIQKFGSAGKVYRTRLQSEQEHMERRDLAQQIEEEREYRQYPQKKHSVDWKLEKKIYEEKMRKIRQKQLEEEQFWAKVNLKNSKQIKTDKKLEIEDFL